MKRLRKFTWILGPCLLLSSVPVETRAQDPTEKLVDTYISVTTMAFPEAGLALEATKQLMNMLGFFDKPDATAEVLKQINERLTKLENRVSNVEDQVKALRNDQFKERNWNRIQLLKTKRELLQGLVIQLQEKPTQAEVKRGIAKAMGNIADDFLDLELWQWSDMRRSDGQMLDPDFKAMPTLELYVTALGAWIAAIEYAGDGNYEYVKRTYGPGLQKHIAFLSERVGWKKFQDDAVSLPENVEKRVTCSVGSIDKYPTNRVCKYTVSCVDAMNHTHKDVGTGQVTMPSNNDMCMVPENRGNVPQETEINRADGTELMAAVADKLTRLKTQGTVREQFMGTFDPTQYSQEFLYAVRPNGELLWFRDLIATKPKDSSGSTANRRVDTPQMDRVGNASGVTQTNAAGRLRNQSATSGATNQSQSRIATPTDRATAIINPGANLEITHQLNGPKLVGTGWDQFREVIPAGLSGIYGLTSDGTLKWFSHEGFSDGSMNWKGPIDVGNGWGSFARIIPAGDGILYAVTSDGTLKWYKHAGYTDGSVRWSGPIDAYPKTLLPSSSKVAATLKFSPNWAAFKYVFAGGEGILYAVTPDGVLKWYHHVGYMTGAANWEGPKDVGSGWQDFKLIFSPGEGVIYGIKSTGEVVWYKHLGYKDGTGSWLGPVSVAADWSDFTYVFPRMVGTWTPPVIH